MELAVRCGDWADLERILAASGTVETLRRRRVAGQGSPTTVAKFPLSENKPSGTYGRPNGISRARGEHSAGRFGRSKPGAALREQDARWS
jgi:hypothetical protein